MQVDAGEFIGKLRDRLALKLEDGVDVMAAFDRACVEALTEEHQERKAVNGLTPGQKAAKTRARNRKLRLEEARKEAPQGAEA